MLVNKTSINNFDIEITIEETLLRKQKPLTADDVKDLDSLRDLGFFIPIKDVAGFSANSWFYGKYYVLNPVMKKKFKDIKNLPRPHGGVLPLWLKDYTDMSIDKQVVRFNIILGRLTHEYKYFALADYIEAEMVRTGVKMTDYMLEESAFDRTS